MEMVSKALRYWKIHALALVILVAAEKIGNIAFSIGPAKVVLIPMLYAFVLGALCGVFKLVNKEDMLQTSSLVGVTFFLLMARYGTLVGPSFWKVVHSAPALLLQEFGNLGTILLGVPVAIALGLGRATVGAAFSIARESSLALIGERYGMDSPEGVGVMGVYVTGTLFGTLFCGFMSSIIASTMSWFSPEALAMACGTGSASMMSASVAPLVEMFPDKKETITAFAATSNMISGLDGVYMSVFIGLPVTEFLCKIFGVKKESK